MTCGKCGAELIGSGKFCASCGAPIPTPSSSPGLSDVVPPAGVDKAPAFTGSHLLAMPEINDVPPPSNVNPFAATASPTAPGPRPSAPPQPPGSAANIPAASGSSPAMKAIDAAAFKANPVSVTPKGDSGIPPKSDSSPPAVSRAVSPLAMSNGISGRTPFQEAVEKARQQIPGPKKVEAAPPKPKKQGTQVMVNAPKIPPAPKTGAPEANSDDEPKKKNVPRTVAMDFNPRTGQPASRAVPPAPSSRAAQPAPPSRAVAPQSVAPGAMQKSVPPGGLPQSFAPGAIPQSVAGMPQSVAPGSMMGNPGSIAAPHSVALPPGSVALPPGSVALPPGSVGLPPGSALPPGSVGIPNSMPRQPQAPIPNAYGGYPPAQPPAYPPPAAQPPGWQAPPQPPAYGGYGFGYAPGARVQVTWSNGQRYPATVSQSTGGQCLVVFPDGQQHWVDMQYLSPG